MHIIECENSVTFLKLTSIKEDIRFMLNVTI